MKILAPLFLILELCSASEPVKQFASVEEKPTVFLGQGEQRLIRVQWQDLLPRGRPTNHSRNFDVEASSGGIGIAQFAVGGTAVRVHRLVVARKQAGGKNRSGENQFLIKGIRPGVSDLWIWKTDERAEHRIIKVARQRFQDLGPNGQDSGSETSSNAYLTPLEVALSKLEEVEIIFGEKGALVRGEIHSFGELSRLHSVKEQFASQIIDQTEVDDEIVENAFQTLKSWISRPRLSKGLSLKRNGKLLMISGGFENPAEMESVAKQLRNIFPPLILDFRSLPDTSPTVHFRIYLLEIRKNKVGALGFSWPSQMDSAYQISPGGLSSVWQLEVAIQALEGEGLLKILSNPELVVRAPGEAELFAGGEIPIEETGRYYSRISWKNFGLSIKLKVTSSSRDWVRLDVATEVSHLDSTHVESKVPGLQSNRIKTQVDAKFGKPLLLSGLLQQGTRQVARGIPELSKIPILGALFGSNEYKTEKSELVAILVPNDSPPRAPIEKIESYDLPRGPVPLPRNWISPLEEGNLRASPQFPWNVF